MVIFVSNISYSNAGNEKNKFSQGSSELHSTNVTCIHWNMTSYEQVDIDLLLSYVAYVILILLRMISYFSIDKQQGIRSQYWFG